MPVGRRLCQCLCLCLFICTCLSTCPCPPAPVLFLCLCMCLRLAMSVPTESAGISCPESPNGKVHAENVMTSLMIFVLPHADQRVSEVISSSIPLIFNKTTGKGRPCTRIRVPFMRADSEHQLHFFRQKIFHNAIAFKDSPSSTVLLESCCQRWSIVNGAVGILLSTMVHRQRHCWNPVVNDGPSSPTEATKNQLLSKGSSMDWKQLGNSSHASRWKGPCREAVIEEEQVPTFS